MAVSPLRADQSDNFPESTGYDQASQLASEPHSNSVASLDDRIDFNPKLLMGSGKNTVDLSRFSSGNLPQRGVYDLDIYLNGQRLAREHSRFDVVEGQVSYCADPEVITLFDIDDKSVVMPALDRASDGACVRLEDIAPGASTSVNVNELRLDVSIPQAMLSARPRGYVDPAFWDSGVTSATLRYRANYYQSSAFENGDSGYVGLAGGVNLGEWQFRHQGALTVTGNESASYQKIASYVQKDIRPWRSRLTLGDSYTDSAIFEPVGIRGLQITSEDQMLPDSMRGYAPPIRGTARTNARVVVTQNGLTLYETTVSPGPFVIQDIYASGYGADLVVTIIEADGSRSSFTVPYATTPQLVRKGRVRFSVAAGKLRDGVISAQPETLMATVQYGFGDRLTLYGGTALLENYQAGLAGAAINTPVGAFSADVTVSSVDIPDAGSKLGHRIRLLYSGFLEATQTSFSMAAYMQSSRQFWDLRNAARVPDLLRQGYKPGLVQRERRRFQISMSQGLGKSSSFYISGGLSDYWNSDGSLVTAQAGFTKTFNFHNFDIAFNLDYSRLRDIDTGQNDNRLLASVTIPLGRGKHRPTIMASSTRANIAGTNQKLRLNGTALDGGELSYGAFVERRSGRNQEEQGGTPVSRRGGVNTEYRAAPVTLVGTASAGSGNTQYSVGVSGGVAVHPGGITYSNQLGDTIGIVEAKGAAGARIRNSTGIKLDNDGYAVAPYLSPYRENTVALDPTGIPLEVQFKSTTERTVPIEGAVVMLRYATDVGRSAIVMIRRPDGTPVPFGATLLDNGGTVKGVVGQRGRAFVSGLDDSGRLVIDGRDGPLCQFDYTLPPRSASGYAVLESVCVPITHWPAKTSVSSPVEG